MPGALDGLKILDFTTLLPGPYASMCLADMGADVLRIVSGSRPDLGDLLPPFVPGTDISAGSAFLGRNKRCITLNLKDPRALGIVHQLISKHGFDILIEQFRPGVMTKLNLAYEDLRAIRKNIIYCSLTGYGQSGPMTTRVGHDINYIARSGIASYSGKKEQGPCLMGMQIADVASGSNNAIIGILAAVISRNATGKGQSIDISMTDGMIAFNAIFGATYLLDGIEPKPEATVLNGGSLYDYYETRDGNYISFGGLEPQFFANFCQAINRPDLIQEGVAPRDLAAVKEEVRTIIKKKNKDEWCGIFKDADACVEPVMTLKEVFEDSLAKERGMIVKLPVVNGMTVKQIANPIKFSETKQVYKSAGVTASTGNHTKEVFRELGYTEDEIKAFEETGLFN